MDLRRWRQRRFRWDTCRSGRGGTSGFGWRGAPRFGRGGPSGFGRGGTPGFDRRGPPGFGRGGTPGFGRGAAPGRGGTLHLRRGGALHFGRRGAPSSAAVARRGRGGRSLGGRLSARLPEHPIAPVGALLGLLGALLPLLLGELDLDKGTFGGRHHAQLHPLALRRGARRWHRGGGRHRHWCRGSCWPGRSLRCLPEHPIASVGATLDLLSTLGRECRGCAGRYGGIREMASRWRRPGKFNGHVERLEVVFTSVR